MVGSIIRMHGEHHDEVQRLLPWYVTRTLGMAEQARVETHLAECAECQGDLASERRLATEVAGLPIEVEHGWARLRRRVGADVPREAVQAEPRLRLGRPWRASAPRLGWALAAIQAAVLVVVSAVMLAPAKPARFHVLAAAPTAEPGNLVVMFRPDTPERALRQALEASDARLVDGPTVAGAYVLRAPPAERPVALARLRASGDVTLAQPIDGGSP